MAKVDVLALNFMRDKEVFSDAFNLKLFGGKRVIRPDDLTELDTTMFHIGRGKGVRGITMKRQRDILRKCVIYYDKTHFYCILGVENQYVIDRLMPVRALIYDALAYYRQILDEEAACKQKRKNGKKVDIDIITGLPKNFELMPVILLVCNFGPEPWSAPTHLHEMLQHIPKHVRRYVPDHFYLLLDFHTMSAKERLKLRSELGACWDCFQCRKHGNKLENMVKNNSRFADISRAAGDLLNGIFHLRLNLDKTKERVNMCQAMDEILARYKKNGIKEGEKLGEKRARQDAVVNLLKHGVLSRTEIAKVLHVSFATVKKLADSLEAQPT